MSVLWRELMLKREGRLDPERLVRFITAFQTVAPLTIGELWAWPSMLKLGLIENLRGLAEGILEGRNERLAAEALLAPLDRGEIPGEPLPRVLHSPFVVHLLQRARDHGPKPTPLRVRPDPAHHGHREHVED